MSQYQYICFVGLDGSGKTLISKALSRDLHPSIWTSEPSRIPIKSTYSDHDKLISYLYDRLIHMDDIAVMLKNNHVVSDRCFVCNLAYQHTTPDLMSKQPSNLIFPNYIIFLDTDPTLCQARIKRRGNEVVPTIEYLNNIRQNYINILKDIYIRYNIRVIMLNTTNLRPHEILTTIKEQLETLINVTN